jgi:hypothetical protein
MFVCKASDLYYKKHYGFVVYGFCSKLVHFTVKAFMFVQACVVGCKATSFLQTLVIFCKLRIRNILLYRPMEPTLVISNCVVPHRNLYVYGYATDVTTENMFFTNIYKFVLNFNLWPILQLHPCQVVPLMFFTPVVFHPLHFSPYCLLPLSFSTLPFFHPCHF